MLTDFAFSPYPPQPESPAPAWLATAEGQRYMQAMARGDEAEARRIVDDAGARNLYDILGTMFDDLTTQP
jgi:hypothetical protein